MHRLELKFIDVFFIITKSFTRDTIMESVMVRSCRGSLDPQTCCENVVIFVYQQVINGYLIIEKITMKPD